MRRIGHAFLLVSLSLCLVLLAIVSQSRTFVGQVNPRSSMLGVARASHDRIASISPDVDIVVPDNYTTIQEAIDYANDNDTIFVRQGTYFEHINVNKSLSLIGEGRDTTIIDGDGNQIVVDLSATSNVTGFTIRNGGYGVKAETSAIQPQFTGHIVEGNYIIDNFYGGILLHGAANNTLVGNIVSNNTLFGIHLWNAGNNILTDNTVVSNGHGITFYGNTNHNTLRNNNMTNNKYNFGLIMRGETRIFFLTDPSRPGFYNDVDTSNTVNGKPVYYLVDQSDVKIPADAGYVWLNNCTNITVQSCDLSNNLQGVLLLFSSRTTIAGCSLANNVHGVYVGIRSFNNSIINNTVESNFIGVYLGELTAFTTMRNNTISDSEMNFGVAPDLPLLRDTSDLVNDIDASNTVDGKQIVYWIGERDQQIPIEAGYVMLINCTDILIRDLNLTKNVQNIFLVSSNNTIIANNSISGSLYGIEAQPFMRIFENYPVTVYPFNVTILDNAISDTAVAIRVSGDRNNVHNNQISSSPLGIYLKRTNYGLVSQNMIVGDGEALLVSGDPYTSPFNYSIWRSYFTRELVTLNVGGIVIGGDLNIISENTVVNNLIGISIDQTGYMGSGNVFFSNNIVNSSSWQATGWIGNFWNNTYPTGGNYWSNYNGTDLYSGPSQNEPGSDGIGDTPFLVFPMDRVGVLDNYPLMAPINTYSLQVPGGMSFHVSIMSNSTVSYVRFCEVVNGISFNVTGEAGMGFCRVSVPNTIVDMLWQDLTVLVNGTAVPFISWQDQDNTYLYFTYQHSTETVSIVPELPMLETLGLLILLPVILWILRKEKMPIHKQ